MGAKIRIEHNPKGWVNIFTSPQMQAVVDAAGERIASAAGEHFGYMRGQHNNFTVAGFVTSIDYEGAVEQAEDKVLSKAVHR